MFSLAGREEPESQVPEPLSTRSVLGTEGHQGPLTCVATNQDGSLILTGSVDCQAKLVSATTGKVVGVFRPETVASQPSLGEGEESESNSVESLGFCSV